MIYSISVLSLLLALFICHVQSSDVWTVNCEVLTIQRSDPLLSPGVASGHVHSVVGGTAFSRSMSTKDSAVNAKATTCDKFTDHSNYLPGILVPPNNVQWCPQLYQMKNNQFYLVPFTGANMYYKKYTCDYSPTGGCTRPSQARAFPSGFRMIAGNSTKRTFDPNSQADQAILFTSGDQQNINGIPKSLGPNFQAAVRFPSCWDGKNADSDNHQSHVAYPDPSLGGNTEGGMCPKSHPYALISIGAEFGFDITGITDPASLVFANGDTTGYGMHADFIQGWTNSTALQDSFATCFDNNNCPWRAFGSPDGKEPTPTKRKPETPAIYEEAIGLNGPIAKLPGNNPVYTAPARF